MVDDHEADRVVIAARSLDDKGLVAMIKRSDRSGCRSACSRTRSTSSRRRRRRPSRLGGVPLIQVESLAARGRAPYQGPDRRPTEDHESAS